MYPVVYSYRSSATRELELSIESLRNLKEWDGTIFVIGDKPSLKADYMHLPVKYRWGKDSGLRSNDEVCAYLTATDFLNGFIIMADDMFILRPWSLEYHNKGTLDQHIISRRLNDRYKTQLTRTQHYLKSIGSPTLSYEVHIPFLVTSEQVRAAAEIVRTYKQLLIRSTIGNIYELPSSFCQDPKNQPINDQTVLYSSDDRTFKYETIKEYLR